MNMHGIIEPARLDAPERPSLAVRALDWLRRKRMFLLIVVLPTLIIGGYLYLFASDQYESEVHFLVRSSESTPIPTTGFGALLSSATGASNSQNEATSVADYLTSHDVVSTLRREDNLIARFRRPDIDVLSRLRKADPTPEALLKYYRRQVRVQFNTDTGITVLTVRSFRPEDSYQLATKLLQLGEQRVNVLNTRSYRDAVSMSERQLVESERALAVNQAKLTAYRQSRADVDPKAQGTAQIQLVTTLSGQLSAARTQLALMAKMISPSSPQYRALQTRAAALQAQIAAQSGRLTGSDRTIAGDIGGFEDLQMRQTYLGKQYDAAATALQNAREQAQRQQLYVVRVVNPNLPVKSLYPERARILGTVVVALLLIYSIGWLIAAGVREHAA